MLEALLAVADLEGHDPPLPEALKRETRVLPKREVGRKDTRPGFCLCTCVDKGIRGEKG